LELLRKELGVLPVQDHDTWQQQRASADDEVKISWCGYCPIKILTDPHYKSKSNTKSALKEIRNRVHPDLGSAKALVRWNRDHLGWKSHDSNQTSVFTLNVCAFEVKTDCRLQLRHE
jgi:hypothetical protein